MHLNWLCNVYEAILGWHELGVVELTVLRAVLCLLWLRTFDCTGFLAAYLILRKFTFFLQR